MVMALIILLWLWQGSSYQLHFCVKTMIFSSAQNYLRMIYSWRKFTVEFKYGLRNTKIQRERLFFAFFLQRMLFLWPISISQEFKWSFTNAHVLPLYWFLRLNGPCYFVTYTFRTFLHFNISKNQDFMSFWIFAQIENMWKTAIKKDSKYSDVIQKPLHAIHLHI